MKLQRERSRVDPVTGRAYYKWKLTPPADVVDGLGWKQGDELSAEPRGNELLVRRLAPVVPTTTPGPVPPSAYPAPASGTSPSWGDLAKRYRGPSATPAKRVETVDQIVVGCGLSAGKVVAAFRRATSDTVPTACVGTEKEAIEELELERRLVLRKADAAPASKSDPAATIAYFDQVRPIIARMLGPAQLVVVLVDLDGPADVALAGIILEIAKENGAQTMALATGMIPANEKEADPVSVVLPPTFSGATMDSVVLLNRARIHSYVPQAPVQVVHKIVEDAVVSALTAITSGTATGPSSESGDIRAFLRTGGVGNLWWAVESADLPPSEIAMSALTHPLGPTLASSHLMEGLSRSSAFVHIRGGPGLTEETCRSIIAKIEEHWSFTKVPTWTSSLDSTLTGRVSVTVMAVVPWPRNRQANADPHERRVPVARDRYDKSARNAAAGPKLAAHFVEDPPARASMVDAANLDRRLQHPLAFPPVHKAVADGFLRCERCGSDRRFTITTADGKMLTAKARLANDRIKKTVMVECLNCKSRWTQGPVTVARSDASEAHPTDAEQDRPPSTHRKR